MSKFCGPAMMLLGGLAALLFVTAFVTGVNASIHRYYGDDPAVRARWEESAELSGQDAWLEFWAGGLLAIAAGTIAVWPESQRRRP